MNCKCTINRNLTSYTYLKACGNHKVAARLDSSDHQEANAIITETSQTCKGMCGEDIKLHADQHYLIGPIADRLYAYEQLGYSPEELEKIIEEHKRLEAVKERMKTCVQFMNGNYIRIMPARANGKSLLDAYRTQREIYEYLNNDIEQIRNLDIASLYPSTMPVPRTPTPENVIFNDPATIVFWKDGTKTVVKATYEDFDPEKGLAMAISKKALGNKRDYYNVFKKWLKKYKPAPEITKPFTSLHEGLARASESMKKLTDALKVAKEDTDNG